MLEEGELIAGFPVRRVQVGAAAAQIGDFPVPQAVQVFCGFQSCQQVVVVDVDGLIGILLCLADQHIEQPFAVQIVDDRIMFPGYRTIKPPA